MSNKNGIIITSIKTLQIGAATRIYFIKLIKHFHIEMWGKVLSDDGDSAQKFKETLISMSNEQMYSSNANETGVRSSIFHLESH